MQANNALGAARNVPEVADQDAAGKKFALWLELLEYARWAPSPHNMQSWRFKPESEDRLTLFYDPERLLPGTDPTGRFCTVGFGIVCEMLNVAAAHHGLEVQTEYLCERLDATKSGVQPFASLTLVPRTRPEPLHRRLILERRTSRLPYDDVPVAQPVLDELAAIADSYGHKLEFSTEPKEVGWVVRLNAKTMFFDMSEEVARKEVGGWIRYSIAEALRRADGLAAHCMCFPGYLMQLFVKHNWLFRIPGVYELSLSLYTHSMKGTRTVAWISGPFETHEDCDRAGRMLARLWLTMTRAGVYLHPFGSVITNGRAHAEMVEHFANAQRKHDLWMLVRLGHSALPPKAERLTLDQLLVK